MTRARRTEMVIRDSDLAPIPVDSKTIAVAEAVPGVFPTRIEIANDLIKFAAEGEKAVEAATRLVVKDQASYDMAADVGKSIQTVLRKLETTRKGYTSPLDDAKKKLTALFSAPAERMNDALNAIRRKSSAWREAEEARRREEEKQRREAEAAEARRLAEAAAAMGDRSGAAQIVADAEERAAAPIEVKVTGRGAFGGTTVATKRPRGEIEDRVEFLKHVLANLADPNIRDVLATIQFGQTALNTLAKATLENGTFVPGFKAEYTTTDSFR